MLHLHEGARSEFFQATAYYAEISTRLADRFVNEVESVLISIAQNPFRYRTYRGSYRVKSLKKYPFSIFYRVMEDRVMVLAIYHQSREPGRWIARDSEIIS
jgi:plasmid stabilization system protein ParE